MQSPENVMAAVAWWLGGLARFLYGIDVMGAATRRAAGPSLRRAFDAATRTRGPGRGGGRPGDRSDPEFESTGGRPDPDHQRLSRAGRSPGTAGGVFPAAGATNEIPEHARQVHRLKEALRQELEETP